MIGIWIVAVWLVLAAYPEVMYAIEKRWAYKKFNLKD